MALASARRSVWWGKRGGSGGKLTSWKTYSGGGGAAPRDAGQQIHHRAAEEALLRGPARQVDQGGREVDVAHRGLDPARAQAGDAHDERHLGLGRVEVVAVGHDAVLAQALAVVAGDEDGGLLVEPQLAQGADHPADVLVGEPDLAVVEVGRARRRSRGRPAGARSRGGDRRSAG